MAIHREWDSLAECWKIFPGESFSLDDLIELMEKVDWGQRERLLWDMRDLQLGPDSADELRHAARLLEESRIDWQGSQVAIVVSQDLHFGLARMFQVFTEGLDIEYEIFRDLETARAWIRTRAHS